MKRFFVMIVAVCAFFAASAQYPMVTLSHNGELSFFDNLMAFESAVNSAQTGDTIFLSEGEFVISGGNVRMNKRVSVVGTGYKSRILGNITINIDEKADHIKAPLFDGVRLGRLYFNSGTSSQENLKQSEIRNCWISYLDQAKNAGLTEVLIDKCYIEEGNFSGLYSAAVIVKNSKIGKIESHNGLDVVNCCVGSTINYPQTVISSIIDNVESTSGRVSVVKSLIKKRPNDGLNVFVDGCYFLEENVQMFDENMECIIDLEENGYFGLDGTIVGIHGGEHPFTENPSVPTVDTSNSSVEYDEEGDRLKVSIKINAD